jgi:hypothetical protein
VYGQVRGTKTVPEFRHSSVSFVATKLDDFGVARRSSEIPCSNACIALEASGSVVGPMTNRNPFMPTDSDNPRVVVDRDAFEDALDGIEDVLDELDDECPAADNAMRAHALKQFLLTWAGMQ